MILGWITRAEYDEQHDPARWRSGIRQSSAQRQAPAGSEGVAD
jgi:hypothetical protein